MLSKIITRLKYEPVIVTSLLTALVTALLAAADVLNAGGGTWAILGTFLTVLAGTARRQVTPVAKLKEGA
jgi:hypothetical protein